MLLCARDADALGRGGRDELAAPRRQPQRSLAMAARRRRPRRGASAWSRRALAELGGLDVLVSNAGVYGPKGPIEEVDWDEWVAGDRHQPARARSLLLPGRRCRTCGASGYGKIINLSGGGATAPLPRLSAYAASKAAVVRLAETLAEEVRGAGIDVNAIAPGALNTRLLDEVLAAGPGQGRRGVLRAVA